jgi:peptidoglycan/xylan/chitin deacetylase (PgdA/CDA1 family)
MALGSESIEALNATVGHLDPRRQWIRNDAFSFWKPSMRWRDALNSEIEGSAEVAEYYLFEHYLSERERRPPSSLDAYYRIKRVIPAALRYRINSMAIRTRRRHDFPHWPCESALIEFWRDWLHQCLKRFASNDDWHIAFWPRGSKCCIVLTHDVESPAGMERMEQMADLEEKYGFRSAWNLPLAQYPIDWDLVARMRARGFEFGAHGLSHDGKLFRSAKDFSKLIPVVEQLAAEHGLNGFRAPSTLRRSEWIATMTFDFDSSFSDTDPYEPQPGGTCSLFPFHLGDLIELPYTLPQDHTLIHLLRRSALQLWTVKARWIASLGGMILALTHPDYCAEKPYLAEYEGLLKEFRAMEGSWHALPSEVARWWRRRSQLELHVENGRPVIVGPNTTDAVAVRLREEPLAQ